MLLENPIIVRSAEIDGGKALGEVASRQTDNCVLEQVVVLSKDGATNRDVAAVARSRLWRSILFPAHPEVYRYSSG
jgi:hypothetical protein